MSDIRNNITQVLDDLLVKEEILGFVPPHRASKTRMYSMVFLDRKDYFNPQYRADLLSNFIVFTNLDIGFALLGRWKKE